MNKERYKVKEYVQTCFACPSQWDAVLEDGKELYIRYRWGNLTVYLNPFTPEEIVLLRESIGGTFDGEMRTEEMMEKTKDILDWSEAKEDEDY